MLVTTSRARIVSFLVTAGLAVGGIGPAVAHADPKPVNPPAVVKSSQNAAAVKPVAGRVTCPGDPTHDACL
jgi:hypothetical protein